MALCYALDGPFEPTWRCSRVLGHYPETPHAYESHNTVHHEWMDET